MAYFRDYNLFLIHLQSSIQGEREGIDFYERLAMLAPTNCSREAVLQAWQDEQRHNNVLSTLYLQLTGTKPQVYSQMDVPASFLQGLKKAVKDELDRADTYKQMYLNAQKRLVRDIFFDIMNDEHKHAIRFSYTRETL